MKGESCVRSVSNDVSSRLRKEVFVCVCVDVHLLLDLESDSGGAFVEDGVL